MLLSPLSLPLLPVDLLDIWIITTLVHAIVIHSEMDVNSTQADMVQIFFDTMISF